MSDLRTQLKDSLKAAMKAKDGIALSTVRLILAALKDRDIAAREKGNTEGIDETEILGMLQTMIKQRRESIALYEQGGRVDLVEDEQREIEILQRFLPRQMAESEIKVAVEAVVSEIEANCLRDMGRTMAELRARHTGEMDFARAAELVKAKLSA